MDFAIHLDNPSAKYWTEQTVSGFVEFRLPGPTRMNSFHVVILGSAYVRWKDGKVIYTARQRCFGDRLTFPEFESPKETVPAGLYRRTFSFDLPDDIPSSFEGGCGHIRYSVEATVDIPWKFDFTTSKTFYVFHDFDLNDASPLFKRLFCESKEKHLCCCCCCCCCGTVTVELRLKKRCFAWDETMLISAEITNCSDVDVKKTTAKLVKKVEYRCGSSTIVGTDDVCQVERCDKIPAGGSYTWNDVPLVVPRTKPSSCVDNCNIIDISYCLVFYVAVDHWLYCDEQTDEVNVLIGTRQLRDDDPAQQAVITSQPPGYGLERQECTAALPPQNDADTGSSPDQGSHTAQVWTTHNSASESSATPSNLPRIET